MKKLGCSLLLLGLLIATSAWGQVTTGSISGTVTDTSGAVVANATVTLTNTDRQTVVRTVQTLSGGQFSAPLLPIGHYSLTIEAAGFKKYVQNGIVLNASDKLTFNAALTVGAATQQVNVEANALQVETQSTQAAGLITGTQVRELALNGRNWEQLMTLVPGVSDAGQSDQLYVGAFAPQGTNLVTFTMNGGRREENNYMIDGADNIDRGSNLTLLSFPSIDSIAEFRVIRGQYDPEYGRAASGQVNVITKSGTANIHGNLFEFWRNDALNARDFSNKYPVIQPHANYLRYNDFGGTIGGPVWIPKLYEQKNKTFFFFSEEARRNVKYSNGTATVPTDAMKAGTFAHPVCITFNPDNSCATTGTQINNVDPLATAYLKDIYSKYPDPNNGAFNYQSVLRGVFNYREEIYKIDHTFSQRFSVSGKILRDSIPTIEPGGLFTNMVLDGVGTTSTNSPGHNYTIRGTITVSPTFLIEPGYAYSYGAIVSDPIGLTLAKNSPDVINALNLPFASTLDRVPNIVMTGATTSSPQSNGPYRDYNKNHTAFANVTKVHGGHTFKFGATYYHYNKQENQAGTNAGIFTVNNNGLPGTGGASSFEQAWANFLLGRTSQFQQTSFDLTANIDDNQFEWYAQDTWRVRPNITVSYGMRYSFFRQPTDADGHLGQFDPAAYDPSKAPCILSNGNLDTSLNAQGQVVSACNPNYSTLNGYIFATPPAGGTKSPYGSKVGKEYNRGIAPRVGVAWDPWGDGKTSVRSGYGIFYDNGQEFGNAENDVFLGTGYVTNLVTTNTTFANPTGGTRSFSPAALTLQSRVPVDYKYPYTQQWSLDIQREVYSGWIFDIGYYGNNGIHLPGFYDFNQPAINSYLNCTNATPCMSGPNAISFTHNVTINGVSTPVTAVDTSNTSKLNALRPYIGLSGAQGFEEIYTSNYNGLQTELQKQFTHNTLLNASYTWSHSLTTYQADRSTGSIMPLQGQIRQYNYGPGVGDRRHVFTANFVWDLPWMREQRGFAGHVLGGWEVSGVQTFQTGLPATVSSNQAYDPTGADCLGPSPCSFRANQVKDPNVGQPQNYKTWFDPTAFTNPTYGQTTLPMSRPGTLRLPGFWRTDLSMYKNLKFSERFTGQFRVESFNLFNHLNPICCASFTTSSAVFDQVTSARDPRQMELGLKLQF